MNKETYLEPYIEDRAARAAGDYLAQTQACKTLLKRYVWDGKMKVSWRGRLNCQNGELEEKHKKLFALLEALGCYYGWIQQQYDLRMADSIAADEALANIKQDLRENLRTFSHGRSNGKHIIDVHTEEFITEVIEEMAGFMKTRMSKSMDYFHTHDESVISW